MGSTEIELILSWRSVFLDSGAVPLDRLAKELRSGTPSIFARVQQDRLMLDLRTVDPSLDVTVVETIGQIGKKTAAPTANGENPTPADQ